MNFRYSTIKHDIIKWFKIKIFKIKDKGVLDMDRKDAYIYFSGATDITGNNLKNALEIKGGRKMPPKTAKLVIGWGAKTKDKVLFPKTTKVLNHPDAIRINRNKFEAINLMIAALNVDGAAHIPQLVVTNNIKDELAAGNISLPVIGRTKYHQGGKGFWNCPTVAQLDDAIQSGAHHFQSMIPIKEEYRLHVFNGEVIHATKKVKRTEEDFKKAFMEDELARQKHLAEKNNNPFDEATAVLMLRRQADNAVAGGANMMLRSNKMGWKFSIVKKFPKSLKDVAITAVKALNLDFGAVDCCVDVDKNPWVFEVNSGPGLEGTSLTKYIEAFNKILAGDAKTVAKKTTVKKADKKIEINSERDFMKMQLSRLQELLDETDDADLDTVKKLGTKLIFGGQ